MGPMQSRQADTPQSLNRRRAPEGFPKLNGYNTLADTAKQLSGPRLTEFFTVEQAVH
jgi:hypothetical protein